MYILSNEYYPDPTAAEVVARAMAAPRFPPAGPWQMVYICSPFSGEEDRNSRRARSYSRFALESGCLPLAPHLLFPQFMNDRIPAEREIALMFCRKLLTRCRQLWVFGSKITEGMTMEIRMAKNRGIPIRTFTTDCEEVFPDE